MRQKPRKKWSDLSPAYRKRLQAAYKAGKFGAGYSSAGRAYNAGAPRQAARGQASTKPGKLSEAQRKKNRDVQRQAKAWSDRHSREKSTRYDPPDRLTPVERGQYAREYLAAMQELEKGWAPAGSRGAIDYDVLAKFYRDYAFGEFDGFVASGVTKA